MQTREGMTLIEVLVALTLASTVIMAGYGVLTTAIDGRERTRAIMTPVSNAATVRLLISNWIGSAHTTGKDDGVLFDGFDDSGSNVADAVTFLTNNARSMTTGQAIVRLSIDTDSTTPEAGLVATAWFGLTGYRRMSLIAEATALNIEYFGEVEGVTKWWPSWRSAVRLPRAVRLTIATTDSIRTVTSIPLIVLLSETQ